MQGPGAFEVVANLVVISTPGTGIFVYSGQPAFGKLVASLTAQSGTDPYGNAYKAGITSYDIVFGGAVELANGSVSVFLAAGLQAVMSGFGYFLYSPVGGLGNLVFSACQTSGTDQFGNAFVAGIASYGSGHVSRISAGQLAFSTPGLTTTDGTLSDFGGTAQWFSSKVGAADTAAGIILQAKNESNDGLFPEIVTIARVQMQDPVGNPGVILSVDPNSPNADESIHNYAFAANFSQAAGRVPTSFYRVPFGVFASGAAKQHICVRGSIVSANAAPPAGTAMTAAMGAGYGISPGQSIDMKNLTGNVSLRGFVTGTGVIQVSGPTAGIAANDIIDIPAQYLLAT